MTSSKEQVLKSFSSNSLSKLFIFPSFRHLKDRSEGNGTIMELQLVKLNVQGLINSQYTYFRLKLLKLFDITQWE
jgi:hypothetical protein